MSNAAHFDQTFQSLQMLLIGMDTIQVVHKEQEKQSKQKLKPRHACSLERTDKRGATYKRATRDMAMHHLAKKASKTDVSREKKE